MLLLLVVLLLAQLRLTNLLLSTEPWIPRVAGKGVLWQRSITHLEVVVLCRRGGVTKLRFAVLLLLCLAVLGLAVLSLAALDFEHLLLLLLLTELGVAMVLCLAHIAHVSFAHLGLAHLLTHLDVPQSGSSFLLPSRHAGISLLRRRRGRDSIAAANGGIASGATNSRGRLPWLLGWSGGVSIPSIRLGLTGSRREGLGRLGLCNATSRILWGSGASWRRIPRTCGAAQT